MPVKHYETGERFTILFWQEESGSCPIEDFLNTLRQKAKNDCKRAGACLRRIADFGPLRNPDISRPLTAGIYELKPTDQVRILYFYGEERRTIVCTHGFRKKSNKTPTEEIERALRIHQCYLEEWREE